MTKSAHDHTGDKISLKKLETRFTRTKEAVVADPNPKTEAAYQKAKKELAVARIAMRGFTPHSSNGSATATPKTLKAQAKPRKG